MVNTLKFILASASPRRVDLLTQIGITPDAIQPADVNEEELANESPRQLALRLAVDKCLAVAQNNTGHIILGADTVVGLGTRILPKAEDEEVARDCLNKLSGRRHQVYGGLAIQDANGKLYTRVVKTIVSFKRLSKLEIDAYIASGEWDGKAGGYAIQGLAAAYIRAVSGSYSNIVGLSLFETSQILQGINFKKH